MDYKTLFNEVIYMPAEEAGLDVDYVVIPNYPGKEVFLLFQGSGSKLDVKIDLDFPAKVYKKQESCIMAHGGFIKAWKSANDIIMKKFIAECELNPSFTPVIAGHSLGGAMAVLAAEDFYYRTGRKANVVTYGCPNVFYGKKSADYVRGCCNSVIQFAQYNDPIAAIPFCYRQLNKVKIGEKFNLFKFIFRGPDYHLGYGKIDYPTE